MARLFLAVPLAHEVRQAIQAAVGNTPNGLPGRPAPPENWHLTLRFIGEASPDQQSRLIEEIDRAEWGSCGSVVFGGFGAFPRPARATVLWLGISSGAETVAHLAATAELVARNAGFPPENRPYQAHLTLSRLRDPQDVRRFLQNLPDVRIPMSISEVVLFRSHLGSGPPRYESVCSYQLSAIG